MAAKSKEKKLAIALRHLNRFLKNYREIYNKVLRENFDKQADFKGKKWKRYKKNIREGSKTKAYAYHRILARIKGHYTRAGVKNYPADKSITPHSPKLYVSGTLREQLQMPKPEIKGKTITILFPHLEKDLKKILDEKTYQVHRWNRDRPHHQMSKDYKFNLSNFREGGKKVQPLLNKMWAAATKDGVDRTLVRFITSDKM
jgi:hypothetical protein